jgi:hypothetical protein
LRFLFVFAEILVADPAVFEDDCAVRMRQLMVLGCVVSALAACGSVANTASPATTTTMPALPACALPPLRAPSPKSPQFDLTGPAVSALHGGAARVGFALDAGAFTMTPPRPGDRSEIPANAAECAALASISPNGLPLLQLAAGGVAVGYGLVSVSPQVIATTPSTAYVEHSGTDHDTNPKLPRPAAYQNRLAWLVVVKDNEEFFGRSGPPRPPGAITTTTSPRLASHGYLVFLVDARTGSDALLYQEGQPGPVTSAGSPSVTVPAEQVSVPWVLESRSPNGYEGRIMATVLPCDGVPNPVTTERGRAALAVIVRRPVGSHCGAPTQVSVALHAAVVTFNLPAHIVHEALGPQVTPESSTTPGYTARCPQTHVDGRIVLECYYDGPGATGGVLRTLTEFDSGSTIRVKTGSVLAVGPLHDAHRYAALPVASSDPKTLGSLFPDNEVREFRAWHAGHADLLVPTTACNPPKGIGAACTPPWIVHVDIT